MAESSISSTIDAARARGRHAAQHFDAALRQAESADREIRLAELAWRPPEGAAETEESNRRIVHLEARISELNAYVRAVHESAPWRIIQRMRRLVGRAW